jgi:hypothetical protein
LGADPCGLSLHTAIKSGHVTSGRLRRDQPSGKKASNPLLGVVCLLTTGGLLCGRTCQALCIVFLSDLRHDGPCRLPGLRPMSCAGGFCTRGAHRPQTTFYPWRSHSTTHPILHALSAPMKPWGGVPLLIIGSLCKPVPRNECPTPAHHRRPCLLDRRARWLGLAGRFSLEDCSRWEFSRFQEAPERNQ